MVHGLVLLKILEGDQTHYLFDAVDDGDLLYLVADQQLFALLENRVQVAVRRVEIAIHLVVYQLIQGGHLALDQLILELEAVYISLSEDARYHLLVCLSQPWRVLGLLLGCHQEGGNVILLHQGLHLFEVGCFLHADRVGVHEDSRPLHLQDLVALILDWHEAMDQSKSSLACHLDGHRRLGDSVHGGGDDGDVEGDVFGEVGRNVALGPAFQEDYLDSI